MGLLVFSFLGRDLNSRENGAASAETGPTPQADKQPGTWRGCAKCGGGGPAPRRFRRGMDRHRGSGQRAEREHLLI